MPHKQQISQSSLDEINSLLASPDLTPREAIRLREQLINSGVKGTTLTLGTVSPELIQQLEFQKSINNDPIKKASLQKEIDLLEGSGRVSDLANTSNVSNTEARQKAEKIFKKQQSFTIAINEQVKGVLASDEFKQAKSEGATFDELNTILNRNVTPASRTNTAIINELAQADIQGETQTADNIERILARDGVNTSVNVTLDDSPFGASFTTSSEAGEAITAPIQEILSGSLDLSGIESFPTPTGSFQVGTPDAESIFGLPSGSFGSGAGSFITSIGEGINEASGLNLPPLLIGLLVIAIPLIIIAVLI